MEILHESETRPPGECDAPMVLETELQVAVMKAINKVVWQISTVIEKIVQMRNLQPLMRR